MPSDLELALRLAEATGHPDAPQLRREWELTNRQLAMERTQYRMAADLVGGVKPTAARAGAITDLERARVGLPSMVEATQQAARQEQSDIGGVFAGVGQVGLPVVRGIGQIVEDSPLPFAVSPENQDAMATTIAQVGNEAAAKPVQSFVGNTAAILPALAAGAAAGPAAGALAMGSQIGVGSYGDARTELDMDPTQAAIRATGQGALGAAGMVTVPVAGTLGHSLRGGLLKVAARTAAIDAADAIPQAAVMDYGGGIVDVIQGNLTGNEEQAQVGRDTLDTVPGSLPSQMAGEVALGVPMALAGKLGARANATARRASPFRQQMIDRATVDRAAGRLPAPAEPADAQVAGIADTLERQDLAAQEYGELPPELVMGERSRIASLEGQRRAEARILADLDAQRAAGEAELRARQNLIDQQRANDLQRAGELRMRERRYDEAEAFPGEPTSERETPADVAERNRLLEEAARTPEAREAEGIAAERERMAREQRARDIDRSVQRDLAARGEADDAARAEGDATTEDSARELEAQLEAEAQARVERGGRNDIAKVELEEMRGVLSDMEQSLAARGTVEDFARSARERVENDVLQISSRGDGQMGIDAAGVSRPIDRSVLRTNRREIVERVRQEVEAFKNQSARERDQIAQLKRAIREKHAAIKAEDNAMAAEARERKRAEAALRRAVPREPAAVRNRGEDAAVPAEAATPTSRADRLKAIYEAQRSGRMSREEARAAVARLSTDAAVAPAPSAPVVDATPSPSRFAAKDAEAPTYTPPAETPKAAPPAQAPPAAETPRSEAKRPAAEAAKPAAPEMERYETRDEDGNLVPPPEDAPVYVKIAYEKAVQEQERERAERAKGGTATAKAGEAAAKAAYDTLKAQTEAAKAKAAAKTATADEMREGVGTAKARVAEAKQREKLAVTRYEAMSGDEAASEALPEAALAKEQATSERRRAEADLAELEAASAAAKQAATTADIAAKREAHAVEAGRLKAAVEAAIKRDFTPDVAKDTVVDITDTGVVIRNERLGVETRVDLMEQKDIDALAARMPERVAESIAANIPTWQSEWRKRMKSEPPASVDALAKHPDLLKFNRFFTNLAFRRSDGIKVSRQGAAKRTIDDVTDAIREELNHQSIRSMERNAPEKFDVLLKAAEATGKRADVEGVWTMFDEWVRNGGIDAINAKAMKAKLDAVEQAQVNGVFKWLSRIGNAIVKMLRRRVPGEPIYVPIFTDVAKGQYLGKAGARDDGDFATRVEDGGSPPPTLRERLDETKIGRAITRTTDAAISTGKDVVEAGVRVGQSVAKRVEKAIPADERAEKARVIAIRRKLRETDPEAYRRAMSDERSTDFATRRRDDEDSDNEEDMDGEEIDPADSRGVKLANPGFTEPMRSWFRGVINAMHPTAERKAAEELAEEAQRILESESGVDRLRSKFRNGKAMASDAETLAFRAIMNADAGRVFSKVPTIAEMQEITEQISQWQHMGTMQGRALAVRRDPLNTPEDRIAEIGRWFVLPTKALSDRMEAARTSGNTRELRRLSGIQAKIAQKTLTQFQRTFGGDLTDFSVTKDRMQYARLQAVIERMRIESAREVAKTDKIDQRFMDKLYNFGSWANSVNAEIVRSALLSGPTTFLKNAFSNAGNFFYKTHLQQPLMEAAALRNPLRPVGEFYKAALPGIMEGLSNALNAMKYERDLLEMAIFNEPGTYAAGREDERGPQGGTGRKVLRAPLIAMAAADAFFKAFYARTNVAMQAYRLAHENGAKPTPERVKQIIESEMRDLGSESWQRAYADATTVTFQELTARYANANDQGSMKVLAEAIIKVRDTTGPVGLLVVPFVMTPMAIIRQAMLRSPVGGVRMAARMIQNRRFKSSGGKEGRAYSPDQMRRDAVDAFLGSAIMALVAGLAYDEDGDKVITGSQANWLGERGKRDAELSASAPQPMSIRVNGNYVSYAAMEPFSSLLQMGSDAAEMSRKGQSPTRLVAKGVDMFANKSSLTSFGDIYRAVTGENDTGLASYVAGRMTSYLPRIITQPIMLARDEVMPARPKNPDEPLAPGEEEGTGSKILRVARDRTPGITKAFPRLDLGGDEVPAYTTADTSMGVALATAGFRTSVPDDQKWKKLIYTRNERLDNEKDEWWPTGWNDSTRTKDGEMVMTAKERYDFHRKYGAMLKQAATKIVTDDMLADPTGERAKRGVERIKAIKDKLSSAMMAEFRASRRAAAGEP